MAHRSRLAGFIIDCEGGSLAEAAGFWSQAPGLHIDLPLTRRHRPRPPP